MEKKSKSQSLDMMSSQIASKLESRNGADTDAAFLKTKYGVDPGSDEKFLLKSTLFYFCNMDAAIFTDHGSAPKANQEMSYRALMYKTISDVLGWSQKYTLLCRLANEIKIKDETGSDIPPPFLVEKIQRYKTFIQATSRYFLDLCHTLYYSDFQKLKFNGHTLFEVVKRVIPIAQKLESDFEAVLEKEFPSEELIKLATKGEKKSKD